MPAAKKTPVAASPAVATKTAIPAKASAGARKLMPATPESKSPATAGRVRLSKAFSRPLDKKPEKEKLVRDRFTFPDDEYAQLVRLKKRLSTLGFSIKKSELVRAGLLQLSAMDDAKLKAATAKLSVARSDD
jgi:RNA:NAD 2'-phosphotransferase (TPT1/KptA family)